MTNKLTPHQVTCAQCGTAFTALRADAKHCSIRCRVAAHREANKPARPLNICRTCGTKFVTKRSTDVYCSDECRLKASNDNYHRGIHVTPRLMQERDEARAEAENLKRQVRQMQVGANAAFAQVKTLQVELDAQKAELKRLRALEASLSGKSTAAVHIPRPRREAGDLKIPQATWRTILRLLHPDHQPDEASRRKATEAFQALQPLEQYIVRKK